MNTPKAKAEIEVKQCSVVLEPATPKMHPNFSTELKRVINERNMLSTKTRRRVTEALEVIESENYEDSRRRKREKLITEIIESEISYVNQLDIIQEFFLKPTQEKQLLRAEDYQALFGNIHTIYRINKELLEELNKDIDNVAQAFSKIAPFFKSYSIHALEFRRSLQILQDARKDNPRFARFVEMQETRPEVQSKLSALLIAPIQRVPRYKLLLNALLRLSFHNESEYDSILESVNKVEEAASHINRIIQDQENAQRLLEFHRYLINGEPSIIKPGRKLEKEGVLMQVLPKNAHSKKIYVVLMNDIIVFCKIKGGEVKVNSLKCSSIFPLNKCKVEDLLDKGSFRIVCEGEDIVLYHEKLSDTREWIDSIKDAIHTHNEDRKTLRKESSARRPVKRKDRNEYNEVGVSPGKKLKKKRTPYDESNSPARPMIIAKRRPIRSADRQQSNSVNSNGPAINGQPPSSVFITLKPKPAEDDEKEKDEESESGKTTSAEDKETSKELFVFGKDNPNTGFTFKMNQWFNGIGHSVKHFFGFRK